MPREVDVEHTGGTPTSTSPLDVRISKLAERQDGVVARSQAMALGASAQAIKHRLAKGRFHELYRGVYAVGHRCISIRGRWRAGTMAGGPAAVLSHHSAAALWGVLSGYAGPVHVTTPVRGRNQRGIVFHHARLNSSEITRVRDIPVASPGRTLLDLAASATERELERAVREAEYLGLIDVWALREIAKGCRGRRGAVALRRVLEARGVDAGLLASELEQRFRRFLHARRLPPPLLNTLIAVGRRRFRADCAWLKERLIVELDGRAAHDTAGGFERDRERDRLLQAAGWRVVRVTWRQLHADPDAVEADLRTLLGRAGPRG